MENHSGRIKCQRRIRHNSRVMPAYSFCIIHNEHMIRKNLTEAKFIFIRRFLLRCCCFRDFDLHIQMPPMLQNNDLFYYSIAELLFKQKMNEVCEVGKKR